MRVIIQNDYQKMSQWAANHVITCINKFNPTPDHKFVLGLPTGSSPVGMYNALVEANRAGKVSFKNVITFNMDEYVGMSVCLRPIPRATMLSWPAISSTILTVRRRTSTS